MTNKIVLLIGMFTLSSSAKAFSQKAVDGNSDYNSLTEIIPPSPNAAALGKYGDISTNRASGALDLSIPLFQYSSYNIKLPVSLNYSSTLKVDEIGSDVGMSWVLNAGGVISRSVYGLPDENSQRVTVPSDFPQQTNNLINFMNEATVNAQGNGNVDEQPDQFSFNFDGYSGKFILDSLMRPILLTYSGLKIESNLSAGTTQPWHFRITTPDGVQYLFGGTATESTNKIGGGSGCGKIFNNPAITSFYLNQIIHPNNDTVQFVYNNISLYYISSINEAMFGNRPISGGGNPGCYESGIPPPPPNYQCSQYLHTNALTLKQINSTGGGIVNFNYTSRKDMPDSLLSSIDIVPPGQTKKIKVYNLSYQYAHSTGFSNVYTTSDSYNYRPFLSMVTERSPDSTLIKNWTLSYNDINSLPPRLSYAQDHYGFFNGKNNTTLIPVPNDFPWQIGFPAATADRNIDTNFCSKGLLTKIVYPTHGQDSIVYQPVTNYQPVAIYPSSVSLSLSSHSNSISNPTANNVSDTMTISFSQYVTLNYNCVFSGTPAQDDYLHDKAIINVYDLTTGLIAYSDNLSEGASHIEFIDLQPGTYIFSCEAAGADVDANVSITCRPGVITYQNKNVPVGGNRVYKVISSDGYGNSPAIKKYFYSSLATLDKPNASQTSTPYYENTLSLYVSCEAALLVQNATINPAGDCTQGIFNFPAMYSNSLFNIYAFGSSLVTHPTVVESYGENFENGGVQYDYSVATDLVGDLLLGSNLYNVPYSSYAWRNARELHQYAFKNVNNIFLPVKEVFTHYQEDPRQDHEFISYLVNKKYIPTCSPAIPTENEMDAYDLYVYSNFRKWVYVDTVRTLTYDQDGIHFLADTVVTQYGNPAHALPTQQKITASDGSVRLVNSSYPYDLTLSGNAETARQALISKYMISPVLQKQETVNGNNVFTARTDYSVFPNGLVLPQTVNVQTANFPNEKRLEFYNYNGNGQILEQGKENDIRNSYIWDYVSGYPIAEVKNATQSDIAYTSFEADGSGNWTIPDGTRNQSSAITGSQSYNLNSANTIFKAGLNSSISYIVSYWSANGALNVNGSTAIAKTAVGAWTYYEHVITGSTSVSVGGNATIDELRLFPRGSLMTSYTYASMIGMTSQCSQANYITYYSYDGLGRLKVVKDLRGNIVKTYDYHYKQ